MKVLFIISNSDTAFWLSEVTHPYWHLIERGVEVDFASPDGGKVVYDPYSGPLFSPIRSKPRIWSARAICPTRRWSPGSTRRSSCPTSTSAHMMPSTSLAAAAPRSISSRTRMSARRSRHFWSKDQVVGAICPRRHRARQHSRPGPRQADHRIYPRGRSPAPEDVRPGLPDPALSADRPRRDRLDLFAPRQ